MLIFEYADAWSFVIRDESRHRSITEVEIEEGIVAVLGTLVRKSPKTSPPLLLELYFLKAFFDYEDADDLRKSMLVQVDQRNPNRPIEERIIIQDREIDPLKEPPPVSRRIPHEHREHRRIVKCPPSQWLPWGLLLIAASIKHEDIVSLSATLDPVLARRIGEHLVGSCRGIKACSVGTRLYRADDYFNEEVDVDHLARIFEEQARRRDPAVIDDLPPYTEGPPKALPSQGEEKVAQVVCRVLSVVVETWQDRGVITLVGAELLSETIRSGLGLDEDAMLAADPMLLFPEDIPDAVSDFQETLLNTIREEGKTVEFE